MKTPTPTIITQADFEARLARHRPADFSNCQLVGIKWSHDRALECTHFQGAELLGCEFSHCKFDNSDFTGADFTDSEFVRCKMEFCHFEDAQMDNAAFDRCALMGSTGLGFDDDFDEDFIDEPAQGFGGMNMSM